MEQKSVIVNIDYSKTDNGIHNAAAAKGKFLQIMLFGNWTAEGMKLALNLLRVIEDDSWCCYAEDEEYLTAAMVAPNVMGASMYTYAFVTEQRLYVQLIGDIHEMRGDSEIEKLAMNIASCTNGARNATDEEIIENATNIDPCDAADAKTPIAQWAIDCQGKQVVLK